MRLYRSHFRNEYGSGSAGSNMFQSIALKVPELLKKRNISLIAGGKHMYAAYLPLDKAIVIAENQVAKNYTKETWNKRWLETLRFLKDLSESYYDPYEDNLLMEKITYFSTKKQIEKRNIKLIIKNSRKLNFINKWNRMFLNKE